jgi:hypothetical protein
MLHETPIKLPAFPQPQRKESDASRLNSGNKFRLLLTYNLASQIAANFTTRKALMKIRLRDKFFAVNLSSGLSAEVKSALAAIPKLS